MTLYPGDAIPFGPLIKAADHVTNFPGATISVLKIRRAGDSGFILPQGTTREIGYGFYELSGNIADSGVSGPLFIHVEAPGADPLDFAYEIRPRPEQPDAELAELREQTEILRALFQRNY